VHDDQQASLSLSVAHNPDNDLVLLQCHAGCAFDDIIRALSLTKRDLRFPARNSRDQTIQRNVIATYDYTDADGALLSQVVRFEPKDFRQRRPDGDGGWINNTNGVPRVLYQLPRVVEAVKQGECIYLPEGEKDADSLQDLGLVATTNAGGAAKWDDSYTETLRGAHVVILPDNDVPGRQHAYTITRALQGIATSIKVLELPGLPDKGDVTDWLAAGGTRDALEQLVAETPEWDPSTQDSLCEATPTWELPIPFHDYTLPSFPVDVLSDWLREYVEALALATQTPLELPGMLVLAVCAAAIAKKVVVLVKPGYIEPVNIFVVTVLPPGSRKSAVFAAVTEPLQAYEEREMQRLEPIIAEAESQRRITEKALQKAENQAASSDTKQARDTAHTEAKKLARELAALEVPAFPRLVTEDTTAERLGTLLYEQGERMAVMSAEGADVFDRMAGRYSSKQSNFGVYLKGHAGDTLRVDRVGREAEYVRNPALTMGLTVQPEVLQGLLDTPGFRGRGLLGRILFALPPSRLGHRATDVPPVPDHLRKAYHQHVLTLLEMPFEMDDKGNPLVHTLTLTTEASALMQQYEAWVEPQLAMFGNLGHMTDWGGKLVGAVARLTGILHLADHVTEATPWKIEISAHTVIRAIRLGHHLVEHARAAFAEMGADPVVADAKHLLAWITRQECHAFTKRDVFEGTKGRFKRVEAIEPALHLLVAHGFIRQRSTEHRSGPGRKPSPTYDVNPSVGSHHSHHQRQAVDFANHENSAKTGDSTEVVSAHDGASNEEIFE
jgi:hypothetical protein